MAETREESQTTVLAEQNQRSIAKENQTGLSPFEEPKTNKSVFQSKPQVLPCFEMNYKFLERHKKTSFAHDNEKARKSCEHSPENVKQKFNRTRTRSDNGRSARVDCHIYRIRNDTFNRDVKFSVLSLADTSFLSILPQRGKKM